MPSSTPSLKRSQTSQPKNVQILSPIRGIATNHEYALACALGGEVCGRHVCAPGPGHSAKDRSLRVTPDPSAPGGFGVCSFAGDDWQQYKDFVRECLGLPRFGKSEPRRSPPRTFDRPQEER